MPWKETDPMSERVQFIAAYLSDVYSMTELCERFGIRRTTGYKWVRRYTEEGLTGLQEKSRAPHDCPHRMSQAVAAALLEVKRAHPHWGPRKILPYLARHRPNLAPPAASTAGELFQRAGLSQPGAQTPSRTPTPGGHTPAGRGPELGRTHILAALHEHGWNRAQAAEALGINRATLWRNLKVFDIRNPGECCIVRRWK